MIKRGEITRDRFTIRFRVYGEGERTIVCVSGAQQTIGVWRQFVSHFRDRYRVIVYDPPGQGISEVIHGHGAVTLEEQIAALSWIVEESDAAGPIYLCAASWGAVVAAVYAERHPDAVDSMILAGFGLTPTETMSTLISDGKRLFFENRQDQIGQLIIDRFGHGISDLYKRQIVEQFRAMGFQKWLNLYGQCEFINSIGHFSHYANLENIQARTLIINGEDDTLLAAKDAIEAAGLIPNCELQFVPGVGHFLHFERADVLELYDAFLEGDASETKAGYDEPLSRRQTA